MFLPPDNLPPEPTPASSAPEPLSAAKTAEGWTPSEPFHPQLKVFSFPRLIQNILLYRNRGEMTRPDELQSAIERALKIKIEKLEVMS